MEELINQLKNPKVVFEGEIKTFNEAGALLIKRMIEEDLVEFPFFPEGVDPYRWLASVFGKGERTLRYWAYDWSSPSGKRPTIYDFFCLISIVGSGRVISLMKNLGSGISPQEQLEDYGNIIKTVAGHIRKLADNLDELSEKNQGKADEDER